MSESLQILETGARMTMIRTDHMFRALVEIVLDDVAERRAAEWAERVTRERGGFPPGDAETRAQHDYLRMRARQEFDELALRLAEEEA